MKSIKYIACMAVALLAAACQPKMDVEPVDPKLAVPTESTITWADDDKDIVWTWTMPADTTLQMQVTVYADGVKTAQQKMDRGVVTYRYEMVEPNTDYSFVFKYTDGTNYSAGCVKSYLRKGCNRFTLLTMEQLELEQGFAALITWNENPSAEEIHLTIEETVSGTTDTKTLSGDTKEFRLESVKKGEKYFVTIVGKNQYGESEPISAELTIGATRIGFLSEWATPEDHIANADDDEVCAWIWFNTAYPEGTFMPFADIASFDLEKYRVLFWLRDLETGRWEDAFEYSAAIQAATPVISDWVLEGGSMLLWQHACTYIEQIGRIPEGTFTAPGTDFDINTGKGGMNPDVWCMGVGATPGDGAFVKDYSTHPIYQGLASKMRPGGHADLAKLLPVKGACWTENHNCLFHNYPGKLCGMGNQDPALYDLCWSLYGIRPLGTWNTQMNWIGQLNVWEAGPCSTSPYQGTILCFGNGGLEFSHQNEDGSIDITMSHNEFQDVILTMAKNAIEYLKTR